MTSFREILHDKGPGELRIAGDDMLVTLGKGVIKGRRSPEPLVKTDKGSVVALSGRRLRVVCALGPVVLLTLGRHQTGCTLRQIN